MFGEENRIVILYRKVYKHIVNMAYINNWAISGMENNSSHLTKL